MNINWCSVISTTDVQRQRIKIRFVCVGCMCVCVQTLKLNIGLINLKDLNKGDGLKHQKGG